MKLGDILRKTEVSFVPCHVLYCGNAQLGHNLVPLNFSLSFSYSIFLESNLRFSWFELFFKWTV